MHLLKYAQFQGQLLSLPSPDAQVQVMVLWTLLQYLPYIDPITYIDQIADAFLAPMADAFCITLGYITLDPGAIAVADNNYNFN